MIDFDALSFAKVEVLASIAAGGTGQGLYRQTTRSLVDRELLVEIVRTDSGWLWVEHRIPAPVLAEFEAWQARREIAA